MRKHNNTQKIMSKGYILLIILLFPLVFFATSQDRYTFTNKNNEERFQNLLSNLRCLVCQNQNLADSNAPLAEDLRNQVYRLINENQSNEEVIHYMTERYGDFVLFKPPFKPTTWLLWFSPFLLLGVGFTCILFFCRKPKR